MNNYSDLAAALPFLLASFIAAIGLSARIGAALCPRHRKQLYSVAFAAGLSGCAVIFGVLVQEIGARLAGIGSLPTSTPSSFAATSDLLVGSPILGVFVFFVVFENFFYFFKSLGKNTATDRLQ